jgi:hypothetical protein
LSRNSAKHLHGGLWEIEKFLTFLVTTVLSDKLVRFGTKMSPAVLKRRSQAAEDGSPAFELASTSMSVSFSLAFPFTPLELLPLLFFGLDAMKKLKVPSLSSII